MVNESVLPLHILLADDDTDDRYFFEKALKTLVVPTRLTTVTDGEELMSYLFDNDEELPSVLFLDINMPKKNGAECLTEIKRNEKLKLLPVVMYSTSGLLNAINLLYNEGAHYYVQKTDLASLRKVLLEVLTLLIENGFARPARENFIVNMAVNRDS